MRRASPSREARIAAGYTVAQIARKLHRAESTILFYERSGWPMWHAEQAVAYYRARGVMVRLDDFHGGAVGTKRNTTTKR